MIKKKIQTLLKIQINYLTKLSSTEIFLSQYVEHTIIVSKMQTVQSQNYLPDCKTIQERLVSR